ncbi:MAG: hypothetical protein KIS66_02685 [Fimbriimonadaceae bacterium]|nr:hypothetical protein [Fimbriimonadaceae bacterium]
MPVPAVLIACPGHQDPVRYPKNYRPDNLPAPATADWTAFVQRSLDRHPEPWEGMAAERLEPGPLFTALRSLRLLEDPTLATFAAMFPHHPRAGTVTSDDLADDAADFFATEPGRVEAVWLLHDGSEGMVARCDFVRRLLPALAPWLDPDSVVDMALANPIDRRGPDDDPAWVVPPGSTGHRPLLPHRAHDCLRVIPGAFRDVLKPALDYRRPFLLLGPGTPQMNMGLLDAARQAEHDALSGVPDTNGYPLLAQVIEPGDNPGAVHYLTRVEPRVIRNLRPETLYEELDAAKSLEVELRLQIERLQVETRRLQRLQQTLVDQGAANCTTVEAWLLRAGESTRRERVSLWQALSEEERRAVLAQALQTTPSNVAAGRLLGFPEPTIRNWRGALKV